ncbi:uncharacterized protein LOC128557404 [Mercenaria mercenaria]|uniref:uncharacterized protein LOC128557404 n=1 Tax=Mercenaria mercenaria TaxID=6596 RepID=UPI00234F7567|nr:uncharacterized protein LOC128557404 [Mercenaria mercenaria]
MGNANMKPGIPDMLEFIKREINKWSTILVNIQRQQRGDVPWGDYIYNEFKETEEKWRRLRIQEYGNQRAGKNEGGVYEDGRKRREEEMRQFVNKINQLSSEKERFFQRNVYLERRFADMSKKISELQRENNELKSKPETSAVPNSKSESKQQFQGNLHEADQKIVQLQKQIAEKEDEMQTLKANVESLEMHVKFVEEEKANLLLRLSKMSGDRLIDNNPAIADLSDPNRPTKLGEVYSELYDNEWTNAFEKLQKSGYEEDTVVDTLQLTLQCLSGLCLSLQYNALRNGHVKN